MNIRSVITLAVIVCTSVAGLLANGQNGKSIEIGSVTEFFSSTLQESRRIYITPPKDYDSAQLSTYPLVLVLDAEGLFLPVVSAVRNMHHYNEMPLVPDMFIVGITNTDRGRDMPVPQEYGNGRGEKNFRIFMSEELIPWLRQRYHLNTLTIVIGHSQGGLFATYAAATRPDVFRWTVALDAPMTVSRRIDSVKKTLNQSLRKSNAGNRYVSIEQTYGWKNDWEEYFMVNSNFKKIHYTNETHESMAYKGIYDGLKQLFVDFPVPRKEMTLRQLQSHFDNISKEYGTPIDIPKSMLINSAERKFFEGRRAEIIELLSHAKKYYGPSSLIDSLHSRAVKLQDIPNTEIDYYLHLPSPSQHQAVSFLGRWKGEKIVPEGKNEPIDYDISIVNGKALLLSAYPWAPDIQVELPVFHITDQMELIVGRRNKGGGMYISTLRMKQGELLGEEKLVGFRIPDDWPEVMKEKARTALAHGVSYKIRLRKQ